MSRWVLLAAVAITSCTPRLPSGMCGIRLRVEAGSSGAEPGVVFVRLDPSVASQEAWALDARDGLPASRTFWTEVPGEYEVVAAGFACPSGCGEVDPWSDPPVAVGSAPASLSRGKTTGVTVRLERMSCGNGIVEPGEACDGDELCSEDCTMDVVEIGEVEGPPDAGLEVISDELGFVIAWIDGSCGMLDCSCLSWTGRDADGSNGRAGSREKGGASCALEGDHDRILAWVDDADPARLVAIDGRVMEDEIDLGATDPLVLSRPAASGAWGMETLGLAVHPELGRLEIRWPAAGSTEAAAIPEGARILAPTLACLTGTQPAAAALWEVEEPGGATRWFLRRWTVEGSTTTPLEIEPMEVDFPGARGSSLHLLSSPRAGSLVVLAGIDGDLQVRDLGFAETVPVEPDGSAVGEVSLGARLGDAATDPEQGVLALVIVPLAGTDSCVTRLLAFRPDEGWQPRHVASWGSGGGLGCEAGIGSLPPHRFVVAFRGAGSGTGTSLIQWTIGTFLQRF